MRKILLVCSLLFVFIGFGFVAEANEPAYVTEVRASVEFANNEIERLVLEAQLEANALDQNSTTYNAELKVIIDRVVSETNAIAYATIEFAESQGVEVECQYVKYEIGHKNVKIDPIIVIAWGSDSPNP